MGAIMPWDDLAAIYSKRVSPNQGAPTIDPRIVIGAMVIKHRMGLDDRGTIEMIQENPYMQYFLGLSGFQQEAVFDASLFVSLRKRIGFEEFDAMTDALLERLREAESKKEAEGSEEDSDGKCEAATTADGKEVAKNTEGERSNQGVLKIDATVCDQYIPYPTDFHLVSRAREESERILDLIWRENPKGTKPRTYRQKARKQYLEMIKVKRPGRRQVRKAIGQQLRYLQRNLNHIGECMPDVRGMCLKKRDLAILETIGKLYAQQFQMWKEKVNRCDERIVNIYQPYVRPIVRGKAGRKTEFGAKICSSVDEQGISRLESLGWESYNESTEMTEQIERHKEQHGHYPAKVAVDQIYGTRENRKWCQDRQIELQVKPLGRPKKEEKGERRKWEHRNDMEGKFGEAKNKYGMNKIRAKTQATSESWISAIFLVMNMMAILRKGEKLMLGMLVIFLHSWVQTISSCLLFLEHCMSLWPYTVRANTRVLMMVPVPNRTHKDGVITL